MPTGTTIHLTIQYSTLPWLEPNTQQRMDVAVSRTYDNIGPPARRRESNRTKRPSMARCSSIRFLQQCLGTCSIFTKLRTAVHASMRSVARVDHLCQEDVNFLVKGKSNNHIT